MEFFFSSFQKAMLETGLLLQSFWTYLLGCHTERLSHSPILLTLMSAFVYVDSDLPNTMNGSLNCSNAPIKAAKRPLLKVSLFRKRIFLLSLKPKTQRNHFLISALASKKTLNQKTLLYNYIHQPLISKIKCVYFLDPASFQRLGQKSKNNFVGFLVRMRTRKFVFKIN